MDEQLGYNKHECTEPGDSKKNYLFIFMDVIHYKVRENHKIISKAAYVVLGVNADGYKVF